MGAWWDERKAPLLDQDMRLGEWWVRKWSFANSWFSRSSSGNWNLGRDPVRKWVGYGGLRPEGHADSFSKAPLLTQRLARCYDDAQKWSFAQGGRGLGVRGSCLMRTRGVPVRVYH